MADHQNDEHAAGSLKDKVVEAVTGKTAEKGAEKAFDWLWPLLLDLGFAGGSHLLMGKIFGKKLNDKDKDALDHVKKLHEEGKVTEAKAALQAHLGGLGYADEHIHIASEAKTLDLLELTAVQSQELLQFFADLTPSQRSKFRKTFTAQHDDKARDRLMRRIALLSNSDKRKLLEGGGVFDLTTFERANEQAKEISRSFRPTRNALNADTKERFHKLFGVGQQDTQSQSTPTPSLKDRIKQAWKVLKG